MFIGSKFENTTRMAIAAMGRNKKLRKLTSKQYAISRKAYSDSRRGKKHSDEARKNMSTSQRNSETRKIVDFNHRGRDMSIQTEAARLVNKGTKQTEEFKEKRLKALRESPNLIIATEKRKGILPLGLNKKIECPVCYKICTPSSLVTHKH